MKKLISAPITGRVNSACPAGKAVLEKAAALEDGKALSLRIVIGETDMGWAMFLEEARDEARVAMIQDADESVLKKAARYGGHVEVTGASVKLLTGSLVFEEDEGREAIENGAAPAAVRALADKAVADGLVSREDMDERLRVLCENRVDELLMKRVIAGYRRYAKPVHRPSCIYVDPYMKKGSGREGMIAEGLRAAADRSALICEGEKAVGKNVFVETVAWLMGMPTYLITFTRQMSPSSVYGEKSTDTTAAKALAEFDSRILEEAKAIDDRVKYAMNVLYRRGLSAEEASKEAHKALTEEERKTLSEAARFQKIAAQAASVNITMDESELCEWLRDGGVMVFNEMNMSDANFLASFTNQLLDGTGFLFVPGRGEIRIHPDCVLFGTQNADYQGTEEQNEATMSRFGCLSFAPPKTIAPQLRAAVAAAIAKSYDPAARLEDRYFDQCEDLYGRYRAAVAKDSSISSACLNIRGFVRALTRVALSGKATTLKRQVEIEVINTCPSYERETLMAHCAQCITL